MKKVFTIGFTGKSAETFFTLLRNAHCRRLLDVRLNNTSQLAGFTKRGDLPFFLKELCNMEYFAVPELAPEPGMLADYRNGTIPWSRYEELYTELLRQREVEKKFNPDFFDRACLLCSEHLPNHCHRRIVLDYLNRQWGNVLHVEHLL